MTHMPPNSTLSNLQLLLNNIHMTTTGTQRSPRHSPNTLLRLTRRTRNILHTPSNLILTSKASNKPCLFPNRTHTTHPPRLNNNNNSRLTPLKERPLPLPGSSTSKVSLRKRAYTEPPPVHLTSRRRPDLSGTTPTPAQRASGQAMMWKPNIVRRGMRTTLRRRKPRASSMGRCKMECRSRRMAPRHTPPNTVLNRRRRGKDSRDMDSRSGRVTELHLEGVSRAWRAGWSE